MRIWLITVGEPLPIDRKGDRLHRAGILAGILEKQGHEVVWWASTVDHVRKKQRFDTDKSVTLSSKLRLVCLHSILYRKNISLSRIINHVGIARKFRMLSKQEEKPDIILCSFPTIELSAEAVKYGRAHGVPVVLDVRDLWPDIFIDSVFKIIKPFAKLLLYPMFRSAQMACAGATAIIGITDNFVEWGLKRGNRVKTNKDIVFHMGYVSSVPASDKINNANKYWDEQGITYDSEDFVVCFIGTIGHQFDLETLIHAASKLRDPKKRVRFVICGSGDRLKHYKQMAANNPNVMFPGWIDAAKIYVLMRRSAVGIDPLPERYDFLSTINNKAIEYMSAGLPVISSPEHGILCGILKEHQCGMSYPCRDSDALAAILHDLCENQERLRKLSDNAFTLFKDRFMAEKVYGEMSHYLERIVASKKI